MDRFDEHEGGTYDQILSVADSDGIVFFGPLFLGPVRAVAIHPSRALLASGGDDYKIKVWGELK